MKLNLDYLHALSIAVPTAKTVNLVLVGCGGTGSWLAPTVVRVARLLREKFQTRVAVTFIDPDVIEPKNCYRQNFCEAEVGSNKAETLAFRFGLAWGWKWPPTLIRLMSSTSWKWKNLSRTEPWSMS